MMQTWPTKWDGTNFFTLTNSEGMRILTIPRPNQWHGNITKKVYSLKLCVNQNVLLNTKNKIIKNR